MSSANNLTNYGGRSASLGIIETLGLSLAVEAVDAMLKAANVSVVRYEKLGGGWVIACVVGDIGSVTAAVEAGRAAAQRAAKSGITTAGVTRVSGGQQIIAVNSCLLASPSAPVMTFVQGAEATEDGGAGGVIGYVETVGFATAVQALDAMFKAAHISFRGYKGASPRFVLWIQGDVAAVQQAILQGAESAGRVGTVVGTCILARPQAETVETLPASPTVASLSAGTAMPRHIKLLTAG